MSSLTQEQVDFIDKYYTNMYSKLFFYAYSVMRDRGLSEEAVQEAFGTACNKIDKFCNSPNPKGWLVNTLKNEIRNIEKNRRVLSRYFVESIDVERLQTETLPTDHNIDLQFGNAAKEPDFALLKRIVLDKYTMLEAATELGITVEACKKRVQRIKKKIKDELLEDN